MAKRSRSVEKDSNILAGQHSTLDQRVKELARRAILTPDEQHELAELKKRKLQLKDKIALIEGMLEPDIPA